MKQKLLPLLLALSLLLTGCGWMDGRYSSVTPHLEQRQDTQPEVIVASDYLDLMDALEEMIQSGSESGVINVADYPADAVENGADEVDMVINIGWVKDQRWGDLLEEIRAVKAACQGKLLKVIIETCLLTDDEKIKMCQIVSDSGADYIKTSTGFSTGGATFHDVELFAKHVKPGVKIKAAGGISSLDDAEKFIELGASRLGTSRVVKIVKKLEAEEK